jgi:hypothetical protein
MGCRKYRSALTEAAAGTLAPERRRKLDEHLARCPQCAARLDRLQRARAAIHRALSESAAAEPSPEWLRGIQQQLQAETASTRHHISYRVLAIATAAVILAVAAWALRGRFVTPPPPAVQAPVTATVHPKAHPATKQPEIAAQTKAPTLPARIRSTTPRTRARIARRRTSQPDKRFFALVKVQPERKAVIQLYDLLQSGKIDPQSLLKPEQGVNKPIVIPPLRIKPLEIPPIDMETDSGSGHEPSFGSGHLNESGAGANKEKTP